jgi:gliding motility-associated-like protein
MRAGALLLALFMGGTFFAQEDCANGLDDDGDGLIDLNDTEDCSCSLSSTVTSLLPNPSLESFAGDQAGCASGQPGGLPDAVNQANCLSSWQRASLGTTDSWNAFTLPAAGPYFPNALPQPLPSGSSVAGFWVGIRDSPTSIFYNGDGTTTQQYREYLATCLKDNQRMEAGESYRLSFHLGFMEPQVAVDYDTIDIQSPDSVELSIYGVRKCEQLNFGRFFTCPEAVDAAGYELITNLTVSGRPGSWTATTLDFTVTHDYEGFAIGGSCAADQDRGPGKLYRNYYFIDDLILNRPDAFSEPVAGPVAVSGQTVCDDEIILSGQARAGASYQWYRDGIAIAGATDPDLILSGGPTVDGRYRMRVSDATGCAVTDEVVIQRPARRDYFPDTVALCRLGDSITLTPRHPTAATFAWSNGHTGRSFRVAEEGRFSVTVTEACISHTETFVVALDAPLTYHIETSPLPACPGEPVTVRVHSNALNPNVFFRSIPDLASLPAKNGTLEVTAGDTEAILVFVGNSCRSIVDTVYLPFADTFAVEAELTPAACTDALGRIALTLPNAEAVFFDWVDEQGNPVGSGGPKLDARGGTVYSVTLMDGYRCPRTLSYEIPTSASTIRPDLDLGGTIHMELGDSVRLNAGSTELPPDPGTYNWYPSEGLDCPTCPAPAAAPARSTIYTLTYTDEKGCRDTADVRLIVDTTPQAYAPNAFSPNGDDANDRFTLYRGRGVREVRDLRIFDRWGELIWEQPAGDERGWDGTYRGQRMPAAVFAYTGSLVMVDGRRVSVSGSLTLLD